jgi:NADH:ubiquinone oxidoreductase subunit 4 (subunit M)
MALVPAIILLPLVVGGLLFMLPREHRVLSRVLGTSVAAATFFMLIAARDRQWSAHWLSRPFVAAFHFGATPISFWIALLLALCTACAIATTRVPRTRDFVAQML